MTLLICLKAGSRPATGRRRMRSEGRPRRAGHGGAHRQHSSPDAAIPDDGAGPLGSERRALAASLSKQPPMIIGDHDSRPCRNGAPSSRIIDLAPHPPPPPPPRIRRRLCCSRLLQFAADPWDTPGPRNTCSMARLDFVRRCRAAEIAELPVSLRNRLVLRRLTVPACMEQEKIARGAGRRNDLGG